MQLGCSRSVGAQEPTDRIVETMAFRVTMDGHESPQARL